MVVNSSPETWGPAKGLLYSRCSANVALDPELGHSDVGFFPLHPCPRPAFSSSMSILLESCLLNASCVGSQRCQDSDPICSSFSSLHSGQLLHQVPLGTHTGHWSWQQVCPAPAQGSQTNVRSTKEQGERPRSRDREVCPPAPRCLYWANTGKSRNLTEPQGSPPVQCGP